MKKGGLIALMATGYTLCSMNHILPVPVKLLWWGALALIAGLAIWSELH